QIYPFLSDFTSKNTDTRQKKNKYSVNCMHPQKPLAFGGAYHYDRVLLIKQNMGTHIGVPIGKTIRFRE
ncbi:MAG: hypothetical protein IJC32_01270, partial [Clostridia bacterium]|nr:hypothetical protein [Clostridia bacterium]